MPGAEAEVVQTALDTDCQAFTGQETQGLVRPKPLRREPHTTPRPSSPRACEYVFDWVVDDLPNWMSTKEGPLLSLPYGLKDQ
jgi:hypothetical protein